ncbi:MAG: MltA domain-containing protein, partial [Bdellovibrionales bacterium]|nr:MltA domain-containing protein [Bdellovibrionales bacterium]
MRLRLFFLAHAALLLLIQNGHAESFRSVKMPRFERVSFHDVRSPLPFDDGLDAQRDELRAAVDHSIEYLRSEDAHSSYERFRREGLSREQMLISLERFRELLLSPLSGKELQEQVRREFDLLYPADAERSVKFTGYFQPTYEASLTPTDTFRYPIYQTPPDFASWPLPHPQRVSLEGFEGRGVPQSPLYGFELAWLKSRWEAYMIHVQGSAILQLQGEPGKQLSIRYDVGTKKPFRGIPRSFLLTHGISWTRLPQYFDEHPHQLNYLLSRNDRFILFAKNETPAPLGSLGVPVIAERSIATDKTLLPPGALGLIRTTIPYVSKAGEIYYKNT